MSGGDALLTVQRPDAVRAAAIRVYVGPREVTGSFRVRPDGQFSGLVTGLRPGPNIVTAVGPGVHDRLTIANHARSGPILAGRQTRPWVCHNEAYGLGAPRDRACTTRPRHWLVYKSAVTGQFADYDPADPPLDVATTTTDRGRTVPYVVRRERGVIDRGVYDVAVLVDPTRPWNRWRPQQGWNGKVRWLFGGDCKPWHLQGADDGSAENVLDDAALSRGFAVVTSTNNILGRNCNDVVSAETVMMLKEHLVERYGRIRYVIGQGCSGGSMQVHWIASNYPGLLDGIIPICSYPDIWETVQAAEDCHLLDRAFDTSPIWLVSAQRAAVAGHAAETTCRSLWDDPTGTVAYSRTWLDPDNAAGCGLDPSPVYHPVDNPGGVRCTLQDYAVSIWGRRPSDGFARRPYDNVGVQYGLSALRSGVITPEQFVDLNERVGGLDIDWNWTPSRSHADPAALTVAYRTGRVTYPRAAARVPIIDLRPSTANLEIHNDVHSYVMRARLVEANGHADNQVIWTTPATSVVDTTEAFLMMDRWLSRIERDRSGDPLPVKVVRNKPGGAVDACWIGLQKVTDMAVCRAAYPYFATPRIAAGGPLADNVLKCRLEPLVRSDYDITFSQDLWQRLQAVFPGGVCDYARPGVGQQPSIPWLAF